MGLRLPLNNFLPLTLPLLPLLRLPLLLLFLPLPLLLPPLASPVWYDLRMKAERNGSVIKRLSKADSSHASLPAHRLGYETLLTTAFEHKRAIFISISRFVSAQNYTIGEEVLPAKVLEYLLCAIICSVG